MEPNFHINISKEFSNLKFNNFSPIQIGRMFCSTDTVIEKHLHRNYYELTIVKEGEGIIYANNKEISVKTGDIFLSYPFEVHKIVSSNQNLLKFDFVSFSLIKEDYEKGFNNITENFSELNRVFHNNALTYMLGQAINEFTKKDVNNEILDNLINLIIIYTLQAFTIGKFEDNRLDATSKEDILCYKIMNYIDTHFFEIKSLNEISNYFNYNYSYLTNLFKKNTGMTIIDYYNNKRFEIARLLINEGKLNLSEISLKLNYSSLYTFSRAYKQKYGVAPTKHKKT